MFEYRDGKIFYTYPAGAVAFRVLSSLLAGILEYFLDGVSNEEEEQELLRSAWESQGGYHAW